MSIAEKLTTIAENEQKVYDAGKQAEYDRFWDIHQTNGTRNIYAGAFAGWRGENFNPKYKMAPKGTTVAQYMFYGFNRGTSEMFDMSPYNDMLDCSGIINAQAMFNDAWIKNLYCDFSSCTSFSSTFQSTNASRVQNITLKVTNKLINYTSCFTNQSSLSLLFFTDDSEIVATISFAACSKLTDESVQSIINALGVVTTTKTITFHSTVVNKLTDEQIAQIAEKGWALG